MTLWTVSPSVSAHAPVSVGTIPEPEPGVEAIWKPDRLGEMLAEQRLELVARVCPREVHRVQHPAEVAMVIGARRSRASGGRAGFGGRAFQLGLLYDSSHRGFLASPACECKH